MIRAALIAALAACGAAQADETRPAPRYVSDMFAYVYTAEALAEWCPSVSVNSKRVEQAWLQVFGRLEADGFDVERLGASMEGSSDAIGAAVEAWAARRNLSDITEAAQICRAAETEMAEGTAIGRLLQRSAG